MPRKNGKQSELKMLMAIDLTYLDKLDPETIEEFDKWIYKILLVRPEHKEFMKGTPTSEHCTAEEFARFMSKDPSRISRLLSKRILTPALPWRVWFLQLISYEHGVAAGRKGSGYF
jgi:hypothetical protein